MKRMQNWIWEIIRVLVCCCFVLVVCCSIYAEPITFARALELSKKQAVSVDPSLKSGSHCRTEDLAKKPPLPETSDRYNADYESLLGGISGDATGQPDLRLGSFRKRSETDCHNGDWSGAPHEVVMNTAVEYIQLAWATAHLSARKQQHELALHLVVVERMRVHAGVDDEVMLLRAKLLEAQSRMRTATLEAEVLELRQALAAQVGVRQASLELVPESLPALPTMQDYGEQTVALLSQFELLRVQVKQLTAARDAAQLAYVLAHRDAIRMNALITAALTDQITSEIRDLEKFGVLLDEIIELQEFELTLLDAIGGLEEWAAAAAQASPKSLVSEHRGEQTERQVPSAETQGDSVRPGKNSPEAVTTSMKSLTPSPKRTIMVLPSDSILTVRDSKQFAAVGIGAGGGKDVTSVAKWSSSNESVAIVSTSGLITAIRTGDTVISANLDGVSRMVRITVVDSHR